MNNRARTRAVAAITLVVALITPWNFPQGNPARKLGAALGAGCSCILKAAEDTPASALLMAKALQEAGVPDGAVNVVFGVPSEVCPYILRSGVVRALTFTGSVPVGKELSKICAEHMVRTTMELGGHAPVLVFDDADAGRVDVKAVAFSFVDDLCIAGHELDTCFSGIGISLHADRPEVRLVTPKQPRRQGSRSTDLLPVNSSPVNHGPMRLNHVTNSTSL